jgi:hypothetical protein
MSQYGGAKTIHNTSDENLGKFIQGGGNVVNQNQRYSKKKSESFDYNGRVGPQYSGSQPTHNLQPKVVQAAQ